MTFLKKLVSGAQTGADEGGLEAAVKFGIETGGWIPKGFRTEIGPRPELAKYNLVETTSSNFGPRTYANAHDSDGTIRFAFDFDSAGEKCTLKAINKFNKPYIDVDIEDPISVKEVVNWIKENNIKVLNVAGNRESTYPGLKKIVVDYLSEVFELLEESSRPT